MNPFQNSCGNRISSCDLEISCLHIVLMYFQMLNSYFLQESLLRLILFIEDCKVILNYLLKELMKER